MIEFISYDGEYPNLCRGNLIVKIDGKKVNLGACLCSGGCVWFDGDWGEHIEEGRWRIFENDLPIKYRKYKNEIEEVANDNIPWGCCGGCV